MEFFDVVKSRRAVRRYKPDPVMKDDLLKILDAANWAPSGMNKQQWEFVVVSGEKKAELGESYKKIAEKYTRDWEEPAKQNFIDYAAAYGGAPVVILILTEASTIDPIRKMHLQSASAAMENLVLAARALGLGTCWMTGPLQDEKNIRAVLGIPDEREIVCVTPLGYPAENPEPPARIDPDLSRKVRWVD